MTRRRFFVWLLPLLWAPIALVSYFHPGDEYGFYFVSSLLGSWFVMISDAGDIHELWIPMSITATGAAVIAVLGLLLDLLRVTRLGLLVFWVLLSAFLLWQQFQLYSSVKEALEKNGSWAAYVSASMNIALTVTVLLFLAGGTVWLLARRRAQRN